MELKKALDTLAVNTLSPPVVQFKDARAMFLLLSKIHHPDKGGSNERFVELKTAWDLVRATLVKHNDLIDENVDLESAMATIATMVPDREPVPLYCIETAKRACGKPDRRIEPNQLRFGYLDPHLGGAYTGWEPVNDALRVPARLHRRLTALDFLDGVRAGKDETEIFKAVLRNSADVIRGVNELSPEHFEQFLKVFMNRNTWCHMNPAFRAKLAAEDATVEAVAQDAPVVNAAAMVPINPINTEGFKTGALRGYVFVTTGKFPLPGTSPGLNQGKKEINAIIVNGGGTNPGSVTGATTHLIVGTDPGEKKIEQAEQRGKILIIDLLGLTQLLRGDPNVKAITTKHLKRSAGYPTKAKQLTGEGPQLKLQRLA
jgi:hypothetical protein